mmetsp:Transcript_82820/g.146348  ORF Transcript_82820/g.146348 Transcript_82820/m.146348 type:complete len:476 (-) Transcript_82820:101-1528(-)
MSGDTKSPGVELGAILEELSLNAVHQKTFLFACWTWMLTGWSSTGMTYMFDAAEQEHGSWAKLTSADQVMSIASESVALCFMSAIAFFGNISLGYLSDRAGRMVAIGISVGLSFITLVGFALARSKMLLILFVMLNPFVRDGCAAVAASLLAEWLPSAWRGAALTALHGIWNIGRIAITILWLVLPPDQNWTRFFLLSAVFPFVLGLFIVLRGSCFESPRWLLVSGNVNGCLAQLRSLVAESDLQLPAGWDRPGQLHEARVDLATSWRDLWNAEELRFLAIVSGGAFFGLFFAAQIMLIWLIKYLEEIGADDAIGACYLASPLAKVGCNILLIAGAPRDCLIDRYPRLAFMKFGFFGMAIWLIGLVLVRSRYAIIFCVFCSQVCEELVWSASSLYLNEAFPTSVRSLGFSTVVGVGNLGSFCANLMALFLEDQAWIPLVTAVQLLFLSFGFCFWLEEKGKGFQEDNFETKRSRSD